MPSNVGTPTGQRCYAITGTAFTGPMYCGSPAKRADSNGRPLCNRKHPSLEYSKWAGSTGHYPHGIRDFPGDRRWTFANGPQREV